MNRKISAHSEHLAFPSWCSFSVIVSISALDFSLSRLRFHNQQQHFSLFLSSHFILLLRVHHTLERLSVKNSLAVSWSARTGNELALNLAPTLNRAEVIKRHMNYDVSERRTDPLWDKRREHTHKKEADEDTICLNCFFCFCVKGAEKLERLKKWDYTTLAGRKNTTNPQYFINCSPLSHSWVFQVGSCCLVQ